MVTRRRLTRTERRLQLQEQQQQERELEAQRQQQLEEEAQRQAQLQAQQEAQAEAQQQLAIKQEAFRVLEQNIQENVTKFKGTLKGSLIQKSRVAFERAGLDPNEAERIFIQQVRSSKGFQEARAKAIRVAEQRMEEVPPEKVPGVTEALKEPADLLELLRRDETPQQKELREVLTAQREPFLIQEQVDTIRREGRDIPITKLFQVDPATGIKRPATKEEEEFFRAQPKELIASEKGEPSKIVRLVGVGITTVKRQVGKIEEVEERFAKATTIPLFEKLEERGLSKENIARKEIEILEKAIGLFVPSTEIPSLIKAPRVERELAVGFGEQVLITAEQKPITTGATILLGGVLGGALRLTRGGAVIIGGAVRGAKGARVAKGVFTATELGALGVIGTIEAERVGSEAISQASTKEVGKLLGKEFITLGAFGVGAVAGERLISRKVFAPKVFREPIPEPIITSEDILIRGVTAEGVPVGVVGRFKLKEVIPPRRAAVLTGEEFAELRIKQFFQEDILKKQITPTFERAFKRGTIVEIAPETIITTKPLAKLIEIKEGKIEAAPILITGRARRAKVPKISTLTGGLEEAPKSIQAIGFGRLPKRTQRSLQAIAEQKAGRPVSLKKVPDVLGRDVFFQVGGVVAEELITIPRTRLRAQIEKPPKELTFKAIQETFKEIPSGRRITQTELTAIIKEVKFPKEIQESMEKSRIDILKTITAAEDVTKPFPRPKKRVPVIKGISIIKEVTVETPEVSPLLFKPPTTVRQPKQITQQEVKKTLLVLKSIQAQIVPKLPQPKPLTTKQIVSKALKPTKPIVKATTKEAKPFPKVEERLRETTLDRIKQAPVVREILLGNVREFTKETTKEIAKETAKQVPKEIAKQIPREIAKQIPKEIAKAVPKQVPKLLAKIVPKEVPKIIPPLIPKEILKGLPRIKPLIVPPKKRKKKVTKEKLGYDVFARALKPTPSKKGKKTRSLLKVNINALSKKDAKDLRNYILDTSLARTGEIRKSNKIAKEPKVSFPKSYSTKTRSKFRGYRKVKGKKVPLKEGRVIERKTRLLDTPQEVKNINLRKRIAQLRKPTRRKRRKKWE